jgi:hypothetical protein
MGNFKFDKSFDVVSPEATEATLKRFFDPTEQVHSCVAVDYTLVTLLGLTTTSSLIKILGRFMTAYI